MDSVSSYAVAFAFPARVLPPDSVQLIHTFTRLVTFCPVCRLRLVVYVPVLRCGYTLHFDLITGRSRYVARSCVTFAVALFGFGYRVTVALRLRCGCGLHLFPVAVTHRLVYTFTLIAFILPRCYLPHALVGSGYGCLLRTRLFHVLRYVFGSVALRCG